MKPVKGFHVGAKWVWFLALTAVGQLAAQPPTAPRNAHPLWEVRGKSNSVYLLGSIHFAKARLQPKSRNRRAFLFASQGGQEGGSRPGNRRFSNQPVCQPVTRRLRIVPEIDARRNGPLS